MSARALGWGLALLAVAACATAGAEGDGAQAQLEIRIDNNLIPPASLDVYLVPRSGIERNLGNVIGSGVQRLYYRGLPLKGEYRIVARTPGNATLASPILVLDGVTGIQWDLQRNFIEITSVDDE